MEFGEWVGSKIIDNLDNRMLDNRDSTTLLSYTTHVKDVLLQRLHVMKAGTKKNFIYYKTRKHS